MNDPPPPHTVGTLSVLSSRCCGPQDRDVEVLKHGDLTWEAKLARYEGGFFFSSGPLLFGLDAICRSNPWEDIFVNFQDPLTLLRVDVMFQEETASRPECVATTIWDPWVTPLLDKYFESPGKESGRPNARLRIQANQRTFPRWSWPQNKPPSESGVDSKTNDKYGKSEYAFWQVPQSRAKKIGLGWVKQTLMCVESICEWGRCSAS